MRIRILRTEVIETRTSFFIFTFTYKDQLIDVSHITMFNPSNHKNTRNFHDSEKFRPNTQNVVAPFDFATYTKGRLSIGSIKYFSRKKKKFIWLWFTYGAKCSTWYFYLLKIIICGTVCLGKLKQKVYVFFLCLAWR